MAVAWKRSRLHGPVEASNDEKLMEIVAAASERFADPSEPLTPLWETIGLTLGQPSVSGIQARIGFLQRVSKDPSHAMHADMTQQLKILVKIYDDARCRRRDSILREFSLSQSKPKPRKDVVETATLTLPETRLPVLGSDRVAADTVVALAEGLVHRQGVVYRKGGKRSANSAKSRKKTPTLPACSSIAELFASTGSDPNQQQEQVGATLNCNSETSHVLLDERSSASGAVVARDVASPASNGALEAATGTGSPANRGSFVGAKRKRKGDNNKDGEDAPTSAGGDDEETESEIEGDEGDENDIQQPPQHPTSNETRLQHDNVSADAVQEEQGLILETTREYPRSQNSAIIPSLSEKAHQCIRVEAQAPHTEAQSSESDWMSLVKESGLRGVQLLSRSQEPSATTHHSLTARRQDLLGETARRVPLVDNAGKPVTEAEAVCLPSLLSELAELEGIPTGQREELLSPQKTIQRERVFPYQETSATATSALSHSRDVEYRQQERDTETVLNDPTSLQAAIGDAEAVRLHASSSHPRLREELLQHERVVASLSSKVMELEQEQRGLRDELRMAQGTVSKLQQELRLQRELQEIDRKASRRLLATERRQHEDQFTALLRFVSSHVQTTAVQGKVHGPSGTSTASTYPNDRRLHNEI